MGKMFMAVLPTGLGSSAIYSKGPYSQRHIKNRRRTTCFLLAYKVERYLQVLLCETYSLRTKQEDVFYKITYIFVGCNVQHCMYIHAVRALCNSRPRRDFWLILLGWLLSGDGIADIRRIVK